MLQKTVNRYIQAYLENDYNSMSASLYQIYSYFYNLSKTSLVDEYIRYLHLLMTNKNFVSKVFLKEYTEEQLLVDKIKECKSYILSENIQHKILDYISASPETIVTSFSAKTPVEYFNLTTKVHNDSIRHFDIDIQNKVENPFITFRYDKTHNTFLDVYLGVDMPVNGDEYNTYDFHLPLYQLILHYKNDKNILLTNDIKAGNPYIYVYTFRNIEQSIYDNNGDILKPIDKNIINDVNAGKAILILNTIQEGYNLSYYFVPLIKSFTRHFQEAAFKNIFILDGNISITQKYNDFVRGTFRLLKNPFVSLRNYSFAFTQKKEILSLLQIYTFRYFEESMAMIYKRFYPDYNFETKLIELENTDKITHFICLNRVLKDFRIMLCYRLWESSLLDKGFISLDDVSKFPTANRSYRFNKFVKRNKDFALFANTLPWKLDADAFATNFWNIIPMQYVNTSFLWITTETLFLGKESNRIQFLTEKTYKPIMLFMPFVMVGNFNSLKTLRADGYQTFSNWWDESYDDEMDPGKRMEKILDTLKYIATFTQQDILKIYKEMQGVLKHNHKLLLQRNTAQKSIDAIADAYDKLI